MNDAEKKKWILRNWNTLSPAKIKESLNRYWSKENTSGQTSITDAFSTENFKKRG